MSQGLLEGCPSARHVAAVLKQVREREDGDWVVRLASNRRDVGRFRAGGVAIQLVNAGKRHKDRILVGSGLVAARLEVGNEGVELAVPVAIQLRKALERKRYTRLREDNLGVAFDEDGG